MAGLERGNAWAGILGYAAPYSRCTAKSEQKDAQGICKLHWNFTQSVSMSSGFVAVGAKSIVHSAQSTQYCLDNLDLAKFLFSIPFLCFSWSECRFTWAYDFFSQPPIPVDGWAGTLRAGELLYMPGDCSLHVFAQRFVTHRYLQTTYSGCT